MTTAEALAELRAADPQNTYTFCIDVHGWFSSHAEYAPELTYSVSAVKGGAQHNAHRLSSLADGVALVLKGMGEKPTDRAAKLREKAAKLEQEAAEILKAAQLEAQ